MEWRAAVQVTSYGRQGNEPSVCTRGREIHHQLDRVQPLQEDVVPSSY